MAFLLRICLADQSKDLLDLSPLTVLSIYEQEHSNAAESLDPRMQDH